MNHKVDDDISELEYADWMVSQFYNLDWLLNRCGFVQSFHNQARTNIPITLEHTDNMIYIHTGENC